MKDLLIVGDSLAGGLPHLCFTALLRETLHGWRVTADAVGGDTLYGVGERMLLLLQGRQPDVLVFEAGTNDVLLPFLKARGGIWRVMVERIEARGSFPTAWLEEFRHLYSHFLDSAAGAAGRIVVTTIACVGEEMESDLNRRAAQYNAVIREEAERMGTVLADVGKAFRGALARVDKQSGFLLDHLSCMFTDTLRCLTPRGADRLSGRRGLVMTIDGVHHNRYGARLFAETVADAMEAS